MNYPNVLDKYNTDFSKEMTIDHFLKNKRGKEKFVKTHTAFLNDTTNYPNKKGTIDNSNFDGRLIRVDPNGLMEAKEAKERSEIVYIFTSNGHIMKIGQSTVGTTARLSSYSAGKRKLIYKKISTPSITNFEVCESIYSELMKGNNVELYVYYISPEYVTKEICGKDRKFKIAMSVEAEKYMMSEFNNLNKMNNYNNPLLSKNCKTNE